MKTKKLLLSIVTVALLLPFVVNAQSEIISRIPHAGTPKIGIGKQIVSIHSYSSQTRNEEGPTNLLLPEANANEDKWCDNTTPQPWVIFELSNYYNVDKFVISDCNVFEKGYGNIIEYKIFVTTAPYDEILGGWDDADWVEVAHRTNEGEVIVKEVQLDTPAEARYVKFLVINKGVRPNTGNTENAIRVYGFDIYGTFSRNVDRGNLVSVGKSILAFENAVNKRETAINILDGNVTNVNTKWCFGGYGTEIAQRYAIIDLEAQYDISEIKIFDALAVEPGTVNMQGVNIYVSRYSPDLSLINMYEPDPNPWVKVIDSNFEDGEDIKTYPSANYPFLETPVTGRFVKIEIPYDKAGDPNSASRIYEVEVYGTDAVVDAADATLSLLSVSEGFLSPAFSGNVMDYTVNVPKEIESLTIDASATNKDAVVTGSGLKTLALGENNFAIQVTSKDNSQSLTYNIKVVRAEKSKISTLKSLKPSLGFLTPSFNADSLNYFLDIPFGTTTLDIVAEATQANAQITGIGTLTLTQNAQDVFAIVVTAEDGVTTKTYNVTVVKEEENLISVNYGQPTGKRIVNIHSYSGKANDNENPYKLMLGKRLNTNGNTGNKWCDNTSDEPWVIMSLTDIYKINRIVIRDGRLVEADNTNVANISGYRLEMSTTGTAPEDFSIVEDVFTDGQDIIDINYLADDARYVKLTFYKGYKEDGNLAGAVWIYGIDIYGVKSQTVDRGENISVGKTVVSRSSNYSDRETPCNLLDGNIGYEVEDLSTGEFRTIKSDPWAFNVNSGDGYVIIDLENTFLVDSFKVFDNEDWIKGYKVLVNTSGNDADWTEVYSGTFEPVIEQYEDENWVIQERIVGPDPKVGKLETPALARFVKLFLPVDMQSSSWNRIREFEVYGKLSTNINTVNAKGSSMIVYPNPVTKGNLVYLNESGLLTVYSLQGSKVIEKEISGATYFSTQGLEKGSYILHLSNESGSKQAKLIVR